MPSQPGGAGASSGAETKALRHPAASPVAHDDRAHDRAPAPRAAHSTAPSIPLGTRHFPDLFLSL
eukprot:363747-Chlamydomonas_euryale.AAC.8